jgi:hypothetical protein
MIIDELLEKPLFLKLSNNKEIGLEHEGKRIDIFLGLYNGSKFQFFLCR